MVEKRLVARMYADYQAGLSLREVAKKHGRHQQNVHRLFKSRGMPTRSRSDGARADRRPFDLFVRKRANGCHEWIGPRQAKGYGRYGQVYAHRIAFERHYGVKPGRLEVMHTCDNPPCVNPAHLQLGTRSTNTRDSFAKFRSPLQKLTKAQITFIRSHYEPRSQTCGAVALGRLFGVHYTTIYRIATRRTYEYL